MRRSTLRWLAYGLLLAAAGMYGWWQWQMRPRPDMPRPVSPYQPSEVAAQPTARPTASTTAPNIPAPSPPSMTPPITAPAPADPASPEAMLEAIVNPQTQALLAQILAQLQADIDAGKYGAAGTQTYNMAYLCHQSLTAFARFVREPADGPDFQVMFQRDYAGRYYFHSGQISLGAETLGDGEGRFLATLFHEYQHYLFHSIYGTPAEHDIVRQFYNEAAAYLFEWLLTSYLPAEYFVQPNGLPAHIRGQLQRGDGSGALQIAYQAMAPTPGDTNALYRFLQPVADGRIQVPELLGAIDANFQPDPGRAVALASVVEAVTR